MSRRWSLALHFVITLTWTGIFYAANHKFEILDRLLIICGLLYGGVVYEFVNLVGLSLAGVAHALMPISIASRITVVPAAVLLISVTISLLVHRNSAPAQKGVVGRARFHIS